MNKYNIYQLITRKHLPVQTSDDSNDPGSGPNGELAQIVPGHYGVRHWLILWILGLKIKNRLISRFNVVPKICFQRQIFMQSGVNIMTTGILVSVRISPHSDLVQPSNRRVVASTPKSCLIFR